MLIQESIEELQQAYPRLAVAPSISDSIFIKGTIDFNVTSKGINPIEGRYEVLIEVPSDFPKSVPIVKEIGNKIPIHNDFHVNADGTLCLGSPLKLQLYIFKHPSLIEFVENLLIPHLYQVSNMLRGGEFIMGELAHGVIGEIEDYQDIFGVMGSVNVGNALAALSNRKRVANKIACPCGCKNRLGLCSYRFKLNSFRNALTRNTYKKILREFNRRLSSSVKVSSEKESPTRF